MKESRPQNVNASGVVSARPRRDNTLWQRQGSVRPQFAASLLFVLSNQTKQTAFFVRYSGSKRSFFSVRESLTVSAEVTDEALASVRALAWAWALA